MEFVNTTSSKLRILIVSNIDLSSTGQLAEFYINQGPIFDLCIVCGPFAHPEVPDINSPENIAASQGDMASQLAYFENIVCRVVYLPSESEPPKTLAEQLHLTPNSVNIHARSILLTPNLYLSGFTETSHSICDYESIDVEDVDCYEIQTSTIIKAINEVLSNELIISSPQKNGIFILNYKYLHTLNHFLFFSQDIIESLSLIIIPTKNVGNMNLENHFPNIKIVQPQSLIDGLYSIVELEYENVHTSSRWTVTGIENCCIPNFITK
jgi:hypothetical protein